MEKIEYRGFNTVIEHDIEDDSYWGVINYGHIDGDLIMFGGEGYTEALGEFYKSVDEFIQFKTDHKYLCFYYFLKNILKSFMFRLSNFFRIY